MIRIELPEDEAAALVRALRARRSELRRTGQGHLDEGKLQTIVIDGVLDQMVKQLGPAKEAVTIAPQPFLRD